MEQYYNNYSTATLQQEQIEVLESIDNKLENISFTLNLIAFILVTTLITSFIRNIF